MSKLKNTDLYYFFAMTSPPAFSGPLVTWHPPTDSWTATAQQMSSQHLDNHCKVQSISTAQANFIGLPIYLHSISCECTRTASGDTGVKSGETNAGRERSAL